MKVRKGNKLIFLSYADDMTKITQYLKKLISDLSDNNYVVVSMNRFANGFEKITGLKVFYYEEFLKKEDYEYAENYAFMVSKNWHEWIPSKSGITKTYGVEVVKILKLDMYVFLCTILKNLHVVLNIVKEINPEEIIFVEGKENYGLRNISILLSTNLNIKNQYLKIADPIRYKTFNILKHRIKQIIPSIFSEFLSIFLRFCLLRNSHYKNTVIMDYRFPDIIKDIEKNHITLSYIAGKGFNTRLKLIKERKPFISMQYCNMLSREIKRKKYFSEADTTLRNKFSREKNLRYKDHDIYDALQPIFKEFIEDKLPFVTSNFIIQRNFFSKIQPKIIILRDSVRTEECILTCAAKSLSIPTLVIQHGLESIKNVYSQQIADSMAVWGDVYMEWYGSLGTDVSRSRVTGYPVHDHIYSGIKDRLERYKEILKNISADPEKPTFIFLGNCIKYYPTNSVYINPDLSLLSLRTALEAFKHFKNVQLVVKLHPHYTRSEYPAYKKEIARFKNVFIVEKASIADLFSGSVAVISELFSSATMDGIILKKPIIFYNFSEEKEMIPLKKRGVGFEINKPEQLKPVLENLLLSHDKRNVLDTKNFDSFIKDYAYKIDGGSSNRVKEFIKELIEK